MSEMSTLKDNQLEESFLSKYGELPQIECYPEVPKDSSQKSKRPTHFLAIRLKSAALWSHVLFMLLLFLVCGYSRGNEKDKPILRNDGNS